MGEIELLIREAAQKILPTLSGDQLRQRLARRNTPTLQHPPRAWCVAVRASDRRIGPWNAAIVPEDAMDPTNLDHPGRCLPHTVTLDQRLLARICQPIHLQPGVTLKQLTEVLGCTPDALKSRRLNNVFRTDFQRCRRGTIHGNAIPVFSADQPLDPGAHHFALPDPTWSGTATSLVTRIPHAFAQDLTRIPIYRSRTTHFDKDPHHPEHPANDRPRKPSPRFPSPPRDYVWYKWKGDLYMGYDWRNPAAVAGHIRRQRKLEQQRAANRRFRQRHRPALSKSKGSLYFAGWRWLCPGCNKPAKVLLLPVPPVNLIDPRLLRATFRRLAGSLARAKAQFARPQDWYPRTFACKRCHRITGFSRAQAGAWSQLIAYLTGGLLYGREVPKPKDFHRRKLPYRPRITRPSPRRQQVLARLLNGWTTVQIRRDLGLSRVALDHHIHSICRQENVKDRHELAKKLNSPHPQPLNQYERTAKRRQQILPLLLQGKTYPQIMAALSLSIGTVRNTIQAIYRQHGVQGSGHCRHRLAQKLNHPPPPRRISCGGGEEGNGARVRVTTNDAVS